jgi:hypothetical protein
MDIVNDLGNNHFEFVIERIYSMKTCAIFCRTMHAYVENKVSHYFIA